MANDLHPRPEGGRKVTRVVLGRGLVAVLLCTGGAPAIAQGQSAGAPSGRQAVDRKVDEAPRQTQTARQTEAPKPAESSKPSNAPAKSDPSPAFQRQPEPQRQAEPQRQHEPRRQAEPTRQDSSGHWENPGPAWRPLGPAWRDPNDRPDVKRPGEDAFRAGQNTYAPRDRDGRDRDSRRNDRGRKNNSNIYSGYPYVVPFGFAPYFPSAIELETAPAPVAPASEEPPLGFLQLRVQPRTADVYVDGVLAGTVDDFGGRSARMLLAGPRRVEIVARGYETVTFDVRVPENDTVTFTRNLDPVIDRPAPEPVVVPHKALYVVPQCYIGDRAPLQSDMPAGCRLDDLRVIP